MSGSVSIGSRTREHREALGMSQDELAQACHVSRQTISSWENGKTLPDIQSLALLAGIFDTGLEDLAAAGGIEVAKRVSADRRELKVLWIVFAGIAALFFPIERLLDTAPHDNDLGLVIYILLLVALAAVIVRMSHLMRKHHLASDQELAEYMVGDIKKGSADRAEKGGFAAFCRRNYFPISIVVGVLFWFALDVVFEMSRSLPATIAFAVAWIVLEVLLAPSHEVLDRLRGKKR